MTERNPSALPAPTDGQPRPAKAKGRHSRPDPAALHEALETHATMAEVAAHFGVTRVTVWRWMQRGEFTTYKRRLAAAVRSRVALRSERDVLRSLDTMVEIRDAEESDPHARLQAARGIIDLHDRLHREAGGDPDDAPVDGKAILETIQAAAKTHRDREAREREQAEAQSKRSPTAPGLAASGTISAERLPSAGPSVDEDTAEGEAPAYMDDRLAKAGLGHPSYLPPPTEEPTR